MTTGTIKIFSYFNLHSLLCQPVTTAGHGEVFSFREEVFCRQEEVFGRQGEVFGRQGEVFCHQEEVFGGREEVVFHK